MVEGKEERPGRGSKCRGRQARGWKEAARVGVKRKSRTRHKAPGRSVFISLILTGTRRSLNVDRIGGKWCNAAAKVVYMPRCAKVVGYFGASKALELVHSDDTTNS
jgi:hypothetical protein